MNRIRVARMSEELRQQISDIFQHHLADPRLSWVSVVRVDLSGDLRHAKVYLSVLGSEENQAASLRVIHRAAPAVRAELAHRLHVRKVPEIVFLADRSIGYGLRVQSLIEELGLTEEGSRRGARENDESGEGGENEDRDESGEGGETGEHGDTWRERERGRPGEDGGR
ncbi:MAG: 30S ribosome-binding factor RbfA [Candidatus Eisenbacteria bacterium]|nr:30S ribosome-binding factor RbfA [Candidatus Eisenbacteria bacterium]